jgi:Ca2+-binding RTX toxin-like protein
VLTAVADASNGRFSSAANTLDGDGGDDALSATATASGGTSASATNTLDGGSGDDTLIATATSTAPIAVVTNALNGGDGNDSLTASAKAESSSPPDPLLGPRATNDLKGGAGNDSLTASITAAGNAVNSLDGGDGNDLLLAAFTAGSAGRSELFGGAGDDRLTVVGGDDNRLADGLGTDWMIGGDGKDVFVLTASDNALDVISGFSGAAGDADKIDLTTFGAGPTESFSGGILTVNGEQVVQVFGDFDPATDLILA